MVSFLQAIIFPSKMVTLGGWSMFFNWPTGNAFGDLFFSPFWVTWWHEGSQKPSATLRNSKNPFIEKKRPPMFLRWNHNSKLWDNLIFIHPQEFSNTKIDRFADLHSFVNVLQATTWKKTDKPPSFRSNLPFIERPYKHSLTTTHWIQCPWCSKKLKRTVVTLSSCSLEADRRPSLALHLPLFPLCRRSPFRCSTARDVKRRSRAVAVFVR